MVGRCSNLSFYIAPRSDTSSWKASSLLLHHLHLSRHLSTACRPTSAVRQSTCSRALNQNHPGFRARSSPFPSPSARTMSSTKGLRSLNIDNINPNVKKAEYAVRGAIAIKSEKYRAELKKGDSDLPFDTVISANIGNPQQLDQKPISFIRQVLSLVEYPPLLEKEDVLKDGLGYKQDVIDRAKWLLKEVNSVGAYSQSQGAPAIRESVAKFIEKRDGFPAEVNNIYLCTGASGGVNTLLTILRSSSKTGVLVPIPQYPLYTATLAVLDGTVVPYYLDESKAWGTDIEEIKKAYDKAEADGIDTRAMVIINPGNPTGGTLAPDGVKDLIKYAAEKKLVLMADEVYQTNIFAGKFYSFKKGLRELQKEEPGKYDNVELASLHSVSKGMIGECGHRGGFFELIGFDEEVVAQLYKFVSIGLCPPVVGQCLVEMMVHPPVEGEPSFELYDKEYNGIRNSLKERAYALYEAFKEMEGVELAEPQGSLYLFPTITIPEKAKEEAKKEGMAPDGLYCMQMLDKTGICLVPGSGFGQKEGTFHLRTTFLAPGTEWVGKIVDFHKEFMEKYK